MVLKTLQWGKLMQDVDGGQREICYCTNAFFSKTSGCMSTVPGLKKWQARKHIVKTKRWVREVRGDNKQNKIVGHKN
jgi:hypothetical protein